jgi:hypothetical protein
VTAEGFKIGEGDCPKWAKLADINKKKAEKRATSAPAAPPAPGAWIQEINHPLGTALAANSAAMACDASALAVVTPALSLAKMFIAGKSVEPEGARR